MRSLFRYFSIAAVLSIIAASFGGGLSAHADSVNSPNITLNVDTNRNTGPGAGNVAVSLNTITVAETQLAEYSSGSGKAISISVRPGYRVPAGTSITAQSATIGFNGGGINSVATVVSSGTENETFTFSLTSGTNAGLQDIIRFNGLRILIGSALGAAGPAQNTMQVTTSSAGGAFTGQSILAASITKGAADRLVFVAQPGSSSAGADLLPSVRIVDFGGNVVTTDPRTISLSIQSNPGSAVLSGVLSRLSSNGTAVWNASDNLAITSAASGYTLLASHSGNSFLSGDTVESAAFAITAGNPGGLAFETQPTEVSAGGDIITVVKVVDEFGNLVTNVPTEISLDSLSPNANWPLLVETSLTKTSSAGLAAWGVSDHLRINKAVGSYSLVASGLGAPIESNSFNVVPGVASVVQFVQQPSNVRVLETMSPAVSAEIVDALGNRTSSNATVSLAYLGTACSGALTGTTAQAASGLAEFSSLSFDKACSGGELVASIESTNLVGVSDPFDVKALDSRTIAVRSARLRTGRSFEFSASGPFTISSKKIDDPSKRGAVLSVTGTTGTVRFSLPKQGWKKVGAKSFQFSGSKCTSVVVSPSRISALCKGRTGSFSLPEPGPVDIALTLGAGTAEFCGQCGGASRGDETKVFRRVNCQAPTLCP
jgi:hypothetical protein